MDRASDAWSTVHRRRDTVDRSHPIPRVVVASLVLVAACGGGVASPTSRADGVVPSQAPASSTPPPPSASVMPSTAALPSFEPDEPLVLFTRLTGAGGGIFVVRPDGTGKVQLGTDVLPGVHKRGDWSPDGQRVVFIDETTERILIASLDGSPTVAVPVCDVPGCDFPSWSPDGTRIAFSRSESAAGIVGPTALGIYVVDVATNEVTRVVRLERPLLADVPRWSPDGSHILFGVDQMDDEGFDTGAAMAVVPVAGGEPRYITDFAEFAYYGDWSRVTDEIVYSLAAFGLQREGAPQPETWDLFAIRSDGTGRRQVTHVEPGVKLAGSKWTPDGLAITAWDRTNGGPVTIDPTTGEVEPFGVPNVEAIPIPRPVP
jgi:Tol biopolymer transport system component